MFKKICKRILPMFLSALLIFTAMPLQVFAAGKTVTVLDGQVTVTDSLSTITESSGTVTIEANSSMLGGVKTNDITILNSTTVTKKLIFEYSATNYGNFSESSASGTCEIVLGAGEAKLMSITGYKNGWTYKKATLTLSEFKLEDVAASSKVEIVFDASLGNVTVDSVATSNGEILEIPSSGATLVATPASGVTFLGWIEAGKVISTDAECTLAPAADMSVRAVFTKTNGSDIPWYFVNNGEYLYENFNEAMTEASGAASKTVVLANNATLPAGDYTIPSGVTLLVPFNSANTLYTTEPEIHSTANYYHSNPNHKPSRYRTLYMADGAKITVNGAISVSAQVNASGGAKTGAGSPVGPCGFIEMASGSTITVNNGADFYAWGYITGNGNITAKSGSDVYECFQMQDFRGGDQLSQMKNEVFPMSQYYVQNIEVKLTLEAGACEHSFTAINASIIGSKGTSVGFIASENAMFNLTSGSVTKYYDGLTDRLIIEANGDLTLSPVSMTVQAGLFPTTIDSSKYLLPINNNITVKVNSGKMLINQDIALLPGAKIIVGEGAECTFGEGTKAVVYDADTWGGYCGAVNKTFIPVQYAPGQKYIRTDADLKDASVEIDGCIDASKGYVYTTAGGANVYSTKAGTVLTKAGTESVTYQITQAGKPENSTYTSIAITPAVLKNADGSSFVSTTNTFTYTDGHWDCETHIWGDWTVRTEAGCLTAGEKYRTCTVCGAEETEAISATGHNSYSEWLERTAAGCESDGVEYRVCSDCGNEETRAIKAKGHNYEAVVTAPTCTEDGYTTHTCSVCKDTYTDSVVEATGHTYGEWEVVTKATHKAEGKKVHTCACGHSEEAVIPVIICDIDNDVKTFGLELAHIRKALLDFITFNSDEETMFDMNDDEKINVIDLVALKKAAGNNA